MPVVNYYREQDKVVEVSCRAAIEWVQPHPVMNIAGGRKGYH